MNTELFQDQFPREVVERTTLALGELARVDAATSHPLAEAIRRQGLDVLDAHGEVSQRRTWFFLIHFRDGQFHLQGRFLDGLSGLPGPGTQTVATSDRNRLAQLAARMIAEPFPLVGTVTAVKGDNVELSLFGSQVGGEMPRSAVFAVSRIAAESGKLRARRLPWSVLEAKGAAAGGIATCRFWHRFREDRIAPADGVVYRALLLPTISGPLKLQVIDQETSQPLAGIGVRIGGDSREIELVTDAAGVAATTDKVAGLALVKLVQGGATLAQFPAPIVDDRPLVCAVSSRPDAEDLASLEIRKQQLIVRMLGTFQVVDQRLGEQRVLLSQSLEKSLEHAKKTLEFLDREIADIKGERDELRRLVVERFPGKPPVDDGDKGLTRLAQVRGVVSDSTVRIAQAIVDREVQTEKQKVAVKLVEQASLLESQAQFDAAIEHYAKAAALLPESSKVSEKLKKLRTAWEVKGETHRQARKFLVETWPKVEVANLKDHLAIAQKALEVCRDAKDYLTPRRFLLTNVDHLTNITRVVDKLKQSRTPDDQQKLMAWQDVIATLRRISSEANDAVQAAELDKK